MHWIYVLTSFILVLVGIGTKNKKENVMKKVAIITGASGGIGSSIAKRLAKDGFSVVVHYAGKPAPAQAVVADIKTAGDRSMGGQERVANAEEEVLLCKESMNASDNPQ